MDGQAGEVFKALADPTRRALLDELFRLDGQTQSALEQRLPMTRFGVAKHLKVLEDAGLVVVRRQGREKRHHLNAVPIQLIYDRWVSKYAQPWTSGLSELKTSLEATMEKVYEIYIKTTPERLWQAITDPDIRQHYQFGVRCESDWKPGSAIAMSHPNNPHMLGKGEVLEVDPPMRLVHTLHAQWSPEVDAEGESRVTWEINPIGSDSCVLLLTHDQMREGANSQIYGGWPMILSGLKTWLETGADLTTPGSLMYA